MLKKFYSSIEDILQTELSLHRKLQQLRNTLNEHLLNSKFRLECIGEILTTIEKYNTSSLWNAPALYHHPQLQFSIRVICWPSFYENNPHQHKTWSVTGVFHNELKINTYSWYKFNKLKKDKSIFAKSNEAGYLLPDCIHNIANPSHHISASIHIFNNISPNNEENAIWYPSPKKYNLSQGLLERTLTMCLISLSTLKSTESLGLINRIYTLSPPEIRLLALPLIYKYDAELGREKFNKLEATLSA